MAENVWLLLRRRNFMRRNRIFRDRTNPIDVFDDVELYNKFRFRREDILSLTDSVSESIEMANRQGTLSPVLQVCIALRFYASGCFQDVCAELIGVHQTTACRVIRRVTQALLPQAQQWIHLPTQREAEQSKADFFQRHRFPSVFGAIDGTQIRIQSPGPANQEEVYVNRKIFHSINVQVVCDFNMFFINIVARYPGSAHDARVLRESRLFEAFESGNPPVKGRLLGDSGYMCREWLLTPLLNPRSASEQNYNNRHSQARCVIERAIGVCKRRWNCLRRLRVDAPQACQIITVCFMLSNKARKLSLPDLDWEDSVMEEDDGGEEEVNVGRQEQHNSNSQPQSERQQNTEKLRAEIGKRTRERLIENFF